MKRGATAVETQEVVQPRTAPAPAREPRKAAKSIASPRDGASSSTAVPDPPAKMRARKAGNDEGAVEHADAASFVLAGGSSLSEAAFAASYPATSWGNPGQIQAKVYVSVSVW